MYAQERLLSTQPPHTWERESFVNGLFGELNEQTLRFLELVGKRADIQARIDIVERNLRATRDHLKAVLSTTNEEVPKNWENVLQRIRFVGVRLGDACLTILEEKGSATSHELIAELNDGQFRFRSGSPLREVTAAMLRQPLVARKGERWIYKRRAAAEAKREGGTAA